MPSAMKADIFCNTAFFYHPFQRFTDRPVVQAGEYAIVFLHQSVAFYYLQGYIQQLHLEWDFCLVAFGQYPLLTVHLHDVVIRQFLNVHE